MAVRGVGRAAITYIQQNARGNEIKEVALKPHQSGGNIDTKA